MNTVFGLYDFNLFQGASESAGDFAKGTFVLFLLILALHSTVNILGSHLVAMFNSVSVWWHVAGVAIIIGVLVFVPDHHASADFVFTERINNSGFGGGMYWFYILPLGFLLTQYTITGFDSCAHISEETHGAADAAAKGVWRSIFYSALIGWFLLLAFTFAAADSKAVTEAGGSSIAVFEAAMTTGWVKLILIISTVGQIFCGNACLTSASRMCYAFSRDGAIPGWRIWSKVNAKRMPVNAVLFMAVCAAVLTIPAAFPNDAGIPVAFYAVVSIAVIGLYIAYVIPIYLRWRMGDKFEAGPWTLGNKYKWMNPFAVVWVALITIIFILPTTPAGVPWRDEFDWSAVNYAPLVTGGVMLAVGLWWVLGAKNTFTGPRHTVSELDAELGEGSGGGGDTGGGGAAPAPAGA
jgi:amino acid transporter